MSTCEQIFHYQSNIGDDYHGHHPEPEEGAASGDVTPAEAGGEEESEAEASGEEESEAESGDHGRYEGGREESGGGVQSEGNYDQTLPSEEYMDIEKIKWSKKFESLHPKIREDVLRDFMAKARFQNYLNALVKIFEQP